MAPKQGAVRIKKTRSEKSMGSASWTESPDCLPQYNIYCLEPVNAVKGKANINEGCLFMLT